MTSLLATVETDLRHKLGIPADAPHVLLFAESTHWDPNWLHTSQEYYRMLVEPGLLQALEELRADPRLVYSIECMFFLRLFWDGHPEHQDALRDLLNTGRLRLTSSGVTTADTLIPSEEALLRDLLAGQEWLRRNGVTQEPRLAYFPDCFGHSPNLPALLNAAGFDRAAVTRIDGMWFMSADWDFPGRFPLPGSSAARLLKQERCLDFTWRAADGSEVLCHWNAYTYGQGDMLADAGVVRIYLYPQLSRPDRSAKRVASRVAEYMKQLEPYSRTPYHFCPIGWDFNPPISQLNELLDTYNRTVYPDSGVWLVNAALDDYFDLIEPYRDRLPTLALDPNPYWTGFYTSRPALKQRAFRLAEALQQVEALRLIAAPQEVLTNPQPADYDAAAQGALEAWWPLAVSNHHDFITGTAPDRVAQEEQIPLLDAALSTAERDLASLMPTVEAATPVDPSPLPEYTLQDGVLSVQTGHYRLRLDPADGGGLVELTSLTGETPLLGAPSHRLVEYIESGGLWRMGYEYRGGTFFPSATPLPAARFEVQPTPAGLSAAWDTPIHGETLRQTAWFLADDPLLYFEVEGLAPQKSSLVLRYQLPFRPESLLMEAPGGLVRRPLTRVYKRTFWPVQHFVYIANPQGGAGFALLLRYPGAVSVNAAGQVEVITQRNAIREKAFFGRVNLLGMPATGIERERTPFRFALAFPRPGEESRLPWLSRGLVSAPWATPAERDLGWAPDRFVQVDSNQVCVSAVKPAWRGSGVIVRLNAPEAPLAAVTLRFPLLPPRDAPYQAWLCDAREHDLHPLPFDGATLTLPIPRAITTLRIA